MDRERGHEDSDHLQLRAWLRLLTCTNLIETRVRGGLRETWNITLPRFDLLSQLHRAGDDGLTMGDLSRAMMVSAGNVTGLVEALVGEGLVRRTTSAADRRQSRVRLTQAGKRGFEAMLPEHERWIDEAFAGLDRGDLKRLLELLAKLKQSAKAAERGGKEAA
ncbi:MAG: MarR family transcriptional regulator [Alphaproteobacteria bacterium]|nr:MarR family transcriptional regulator [Alphaproteobacteria bacterium]MCA0450806.1 MarR family transcriptional regulator [Pseudomonadota bacterium]